MLELEVEEGDGLDAARARIAAAVAAGKSRRTVDRMAAALGVAWGITWTGAVQVLALEEGATGGLW